MDVYHHTEDMYTWSEVMYSICTALCMYILYYTITVCSRECMYTIIQSICIHREYVTIDTTSCSESIYIEQSMYMYYNDTEYDVYMEDGVSTMIYTSRVYPKHMQYVYILSYRVAESIS